MKVARAAWLWSHGTHIKSDFSREFQQRRARLDAGRCHK